MSFTYTTRGSIGITSPINSILKNRGIDNVDLFLKPTEKCLESVYCLDNINEAANLFLTHMKKKSRVTVLQDCDCDGITSAALILLYIKRNYPDIETNYIIHNGKEHGLDNSSMEKVLEQKPDLLIIPDAGNDNLRQFKQLRKQGIDIIVLDHHDPTKQVMRFMKIFRLTNLNDFAIIVNNQMSPKATDKSMTGVGIVYKFCMLVDTLTGRSTADDYLDLVALGMIADSCDVTNLQSRYLVFRGMEQMNNGASKNKFITLLVQSQQYSLKGKVTMLGISFVLAPLINSLIRLGTMDDKEILLKAFLNSEETYEEKIRGKGLVTISAQEKALRLCESSKRKQKKLTDEYVEQIGLQVEEFNLNNYPVVCCKADESVTNTFTGLVANKLTSVYQKPCIVLRDRGDVLTGSARGYEQSAINDIKAFCNNTGLFTFAEGHPSACGVNIPRENIGKFYDYLSTLPVSSQIVYEVDAKFNDNTLSKNIISTVAKYSDVWAKSSEEPLFAIENIIMPTKEISLIGQKLNTIKFTYHSIDFIEFNCKEQDYKDIINAGDYVKLTIIGKFVTNEYEGKKTPQVQIKDMMYEKSNAPVKAFRF